MTILLQHLQKQYVKKDCSKGFCNDRKLATEFRTIFAAMKYLISINEESITEYKFIEHDEPKSARQHIRSPLIINKRNRFT